MGFLCSFVPQSSRRHLFPLIKNCSNLWIYAELILHILCVSITSYLCHCFALWEKLKKAHFDAWKWVLQNMQQIIRVSRATGALKTCFIWLPLWWYSLGEQVKDDSFDSFDSAPQKNDSGHIMLSTLVLQVSYLNLQTSFFGMLHYLRMLSGASLVW